MTAYDDVDFGEECPNCGELMMDCVCFEIPDEEIEYLDMEGAEY